MKFIIHPKRVIRNLGVGHVIYGRTVMELTEDQVRYCLKYGAVETMNGIQVTLENIADVFNPSNNMEEVNTFVTKEPEKSENSEQVEVKEEKKETPKKEEKIDDNKEPVKEENDTKEPEKNENSEQVEVKETKSAPKSTRNKNKK